MELKKLLKSLTEQKGSDLHLKVGARPIIRKNGKLSILNQEFPAIDYKAMQEMVTPLLDEKSQEKLHKYGSVDVGYGLIDLGRFRCNIAFQRGSIRVVIRRIPYEIPTLKELNLPEKLLEIVNNAQRGLILISGNTGSGKSTTLATLINHINHTKSKHIVTIEDPIEFLIKDHYCLITQRDMGMDFFDPDMALKASLRQDPDIILFSELRVKDTIQTALTAAETGHLVFSTVHTQAAAESINRLLNVFDGNEREAMKSILSNVLLAVIGQRLVPKKNKKGVIPAVEIMINNVRMQKAIQSRASTQALRDIIKDSALAYGMQSYDQHLAELVKKNLVSEEQALSVATAPNNLKMILSGISFASYQESGS